MKNYIDKRPIQQNTQLPYEWPKDGDRRHLHPEAVFCECGEQVCDTNPRLNDQYTKCRKCGAPQPTTTQKG